MARKHHTAATTEPPAVLTRTMLAALRPIDVAIEGDMSSALSQVILVTTSGSSCIQPRLAKRPSWTFESKNRLSSTSPAALTGAAATFAASTASADWLFAFVPGHQPSLRAARHATSKSAPARPLLRA
jgi:hypothetical protein